MSLLTNPSTTTAYTLKQDMTHNGVWSLQSFLDHIGYYTDANGNKLPITGFFGNGTAYAVKRYQRAKGLIDDAVVGPKTSAIIVHSIVTRVPNGDKLPRDLVEGVVQAESGGLLGAVNSSVLGGLDLCLAQRRVYGPPFDADEVAKALDPFENVADSVSNDDKTGIYDRYLVYSKRVGTGEYAWRLAALAHNWPWAADTLSQGGKLSTTQKATWVPDGTKFTDGAPVVSWRDWAEFYALGSLKHTHAGLVTGAAFGLPTR